MGQLVRDVEALHLLLVDAVAGQLLQEGRHKDQEFGVPAVQQRDLKNILVLVASNISPIGCVKTC